MYEPYCANYTNACEIMLEETTHLAVRSPSFAWRPLWQLTKHAHTGCGQRSQQQV